MASEAMEAQTIIMGLVNAINSAIDCGDWKVDGRCDPSIALEAGEEWLIWRGFDRNELEQFAKEA
jgi:hypothetical protein